MLNFLATTGTNTQRDFNVLQCSHRLNVAHQIEANIFYLWLSAEIKSNK